MIFGALLLLVILIALWVTGLIASLFWSDARRNSKLGAGFIVWGFILLFFIASYLLGNLVLSLIS